MRDPRRPSFLIHGGLETMRFCRLCGDPIVGSELDPCEVSVEPTWSRVREQGGEVHIFYCHAACLRVRFRFRFYEEGEEEEGEEEEPALTEN